MTQITINLLDPIGTINPNIYGHFAEHLGRCIYRCQARILTGEIHSHNTFERPEAIQPQALAVVPTGSRFTVTLPAAAVAALEISLD